MTAADVKQAEEALIELDPKLGEVIIRQRPLAPRDRGGYFESLCRSIIGQQVSVASASAIYGRLAVVTSLDPINVAALDEAAMKTIGLSRQKLSYLVDLAVHFVDQPDIYDHLETSGDDEAIDELTAIKGIGVWTAQMFLMFTLGRADVFAPDDVGLQNAMKRLYGWEVLPKKAELTEFALRWAPHRTTASLHLWASLNNAPNIT
ncbi:DNA-3-methyladenine glycosylase 2 family protein [Candidatus Saccharibacteria bacterium]|nr:DNA-3-methyladenine glycosylase 2 family protein [Candidatus Saccharibacteria bacterium]